MTLLKIAEFKEILNKLEFFKQREEKETLKRHYRNAIRSLAIILEKDTKNLS